MSWLTDTFYNDAGNLPIYGLVLLMAFAILFVSIFFHELGHWIYFKLKLKKNVKIKFHYEGIGKIYWTTGGEKDYEGLNDIQLNGIYVVGIALGTVPILVSAYFWFPFCLLILPYASGSWSDIKKVLAKARIDDE